MAKLFQEHVLGRQSDLDTVIISCLFIFANRSKIGRGRDEAGDIHHESTLRANTER